MPPADWRMLVPCSNCPFSKSPGGVRQRNALRAIRWRQILADLRGGGMFWCHKTTRKDDDDYDEDGVYIPNGKEKMCAGAIAWQEARRCTSNYQRVAENLDYFAEKRKEKTNAVAESRPADRDLLSGDRRRRAVARRPSQADGQGLPARVQRRVQRGGPTPPDAGVPDQRQGRVRRPGTRRGTDAPAPASVRRSTPRSSR